MAVPNSPPKTSIPGPIKPLLPLLPGGALLPGSISNPFGGLESAAHNTTQLIEDVTSPKFWLRLGEGLVGVILIFVGLNHVFDISGKAKSGATKAASFAPEGKVVSKAAAAPKVTTKVAGTGKTYKPTVHKGADLPTVNLFNGGR